MSNSVRCPRCRILHEDLNELRLDDGEHAAIECDCGYQFEIVCWISIDYDIEEVE